MAAMMTSVMTDTRKLALYMQECRTMGIRILPPDINLSESGFSAAGHDIRYGLSAIRGVGKTVIDQIVAERERGGLYRDLTDLVERLAGQELNKKTLENFIKAGVLDSFGLTRKQMISIYEDVVDRVSYEKKNAMQGQMSLFDLMDHTEQEKYHIRVPDTGEFDRDDILRFEKMITGIYISGHPLDQYPDVLKQCVTAESVDFMIDEEGHVSIQDGTHAVIGGIIEKVTPKNARNGQAMAFLTLEDLLGTVEVIIFPRDYAYCRNQIWEGNIVLVSGMAITIHPFAIPAEKTLAGINSSLLVDIPLMFAGMIILCIPPLVKGKLSRWQGILLLALYAGFTVFQFVM